MCLTKTRNLDLSIYLCRWRSANRERNAQPSPGYDRMRLFPRPRELFKVSDQSLASTAPRRIFDLLARLAKKEPSILYGVTGCV